MQYQRPTLGQKQQLKLSPQMLQSIQIMSLPMLDLKLRIQQELDENPALAVVEESASISIDEVRQERRSDGEEYFENSSDPGFLKSSGYDQDGSDAKRQFMENALSRPENLHDHLVWQLRLQPLDEDYFRIGELLILNLDENGFYIEDPWQLVKDNERELADELIQMIRHFEPSGCCTPNYIESLKVQASMLDDVPAAVFPIIEEHLEELNKQHFREISKALSISLEEVELSLEIIRQLTPYPGREYSSAEPHYVIPDVAVSKESGEFKILVNEEEIPVLGLDTFFDQLNQSSRDKNSPDRDSRKFVTEKVKEARWFISSIQQRNATLKKVTLAIVEYQREFFLHGPKSIVPLTLRNVADDIGIHEATVSRLTRGKYMQTDFGIFELKYFFTNAVGGTRKGGGSYGKEAVKAIIQEILEGNARKQLSDQKISELLEKRGIKIARRTVTKYRKELDMPSSYNR